MQFDSYTFGSLPIDRTVYDYDVIIDRGEIRKRKKDRPRSTKSSSATRPSR